MIPRVVPVNTAGQDSRRMHSIAYSRRFLPRFGATLAVRLSSGRAFIKLRSGWRSWLLFAVTAMARDVSAQATVSQRDSAWFAIEAVGRFQSSSLARKWRPDLPAAKASQILVSGAVVRAIAATLHPQTFDPSMQTPLEFTLLDAGAPCAKPATVERARCALESSEFYIDVESIGWRPSTAFVDLKAFVADPRAPLGFLSLHVVAVFQRHGDSWSFDKVLRVEK